MKQKTVLVYLDCDDVSVSWAVVVKQPDDVPEGYTTIAEITEDTLARWRLTAQLFEMMQNEMADLTEQANATSRLR